MLHHGLPRAFQLTVLAGCALLLATSPASAGKSSGIHRPNDPPARLNSDAWKGVPTTPATAAELDRLIDQTLKTANRTPAPLTTDEQFLRRVTLDLTGQLPTPTETAAFAADRDPAKRAKKIDALLASDAFAKHWAMYWRDVVLAKVTDRRSQAAVPSFTIWLNEQFQKNRPWDQMAREMITAKGILNIGTPNAENGAAFFLLAHLGGDSVNDRTAETSRVFLGIRIECAQCHDHPFDAWKQEQFHQLAGYFARTRDRLARVPGQQGRFNLELMSLPRGEQRLPGKSDSSGAAVQPRFLTGQTIAEGLSDGERRKALADVITAPDNYWFAAAYVNRIWGELLGQAFMQPVDDLGPDREVIMPKVLARVAASFKGSGYDQKAFFRLVMNTQAYQRQVRPGRTADEHLRFAAVAPTRLRPDALWDSLVGVLGQLGEAGPGAPRRPGAGMGPYGRRFTLEGAFKALFFTDPSLKADDVEGSIPQALLMMNSPALHQKIRAQGENTLAQILEKNAKDADAVRALYLRTLARKPTDRELGKATAYVTKVGNRTEAFEDLLWALLNSTEFQTKR